MDIDSVFKIYNTKAGISFQWRKNAELTQVIFRDTGFHLSVNEIEIFLEQVLVSRTKQPCTCCRLGADCRSMLLQTPFSKVTMAISLNELDEIEDLLRGTLFQLELNRYLQEVCKN